MENLQGGTLALEHHYVVDQLEGRVAFVTRYRGTHETFREPIWIDVYDPIAEAGGNLTIARRLKASALRTSRLEGDGVLGVLDYGEIDEGVPFVITQRVVGPTLADLLERDGTLSPEECAALVTRLADILARAHERELYHGNLVPEWIFVPDEELERAAIGHFEMGLSLDEMRALNGAVLGVPSAWPLPPETFRDEIDPQAPFSAAGDLYALGAIAYTALVGHHPYFADDTDPADGILRIQQQAPRPLTELGFESELSDVIARALDPSPHERYDDVESFADALRRVTGVETEEPPPGETGEEVDERAAQPAVESAEFSPPDEAYEAFDHTEPSQLGSLAALAVGLLIISNIAWFFVLLGDDSAADPAPETPTPTSRERNVSLDRGIQLITEPGGAQVELAEDGTVLGETPMVLDPTLGNDGMLKLTVTHDGYHPERLEIREKSDDTARDLVLHLDPRESGD